MRSFFSTRGFLIGCLIIAWCTVSCKNESQNKDPRPVDTTQKSIDTPATVYANDRFKNVTAERLGDTTFRITGNAQVFEASFSWVIEDGHNELKQGHEMTDAGAPEFGKFDFTVSTTKASDNSTLHLILFESSAKDGSRQHELPVPLY